MHDDDGQDAVILQRTGLIITTQGCGKMIRTTVRMSMRKSLASVAQRQTEQAHQYTQRQYYTCSTVQGLRLSLSLQPRQCPLLVSCGTGLRNGPRQPLE